MAKNVKVFFPHSETKIPGYGILDHIYMYFIGGHKQIVHVHFIIKDDIRRHRPFVSIK